MPVPYAVDVPLRWSDMDAYGHVNNVQYLRLLEDARVHALRDWFPADSAPLRRGIVVTRHEIEYRRTLGYRPEPVRIDMWVTRLHGAGYDIGYVVREPDEADPAVYAVAESTLIFFDMATEASRRMSAQERELLTARLGEAVPFRRRRP